MKNSWIGYIAAAVLAGTGYYLGVPVEAILIAIAAGTVVEYFIINNRRGDRK